MDSEYTWGHGKCSRCKKTDYCVILDDQKDTDSPGMCPWCLFEAGWLMPPSERKGAGMDAKDERIRELENGLRHIGCHSMHDSKTSRRDLMRKLSAISEIEMAVSPEQHAPVPKEARLLKERAEEAEQERDAALKENRDLTQMVMRLKQEIAEMVNEA